GDATDTAGQRCPADYHGGDNIQFQSFSELSGSRHRPSSLQQPRYAAKRTQEGEHPDFNSDHPNPGESCYPLTSANGSHLTSKYGPIENNIGQRSQDQPNDNGMRNTERSIGKCRKKSFTIDRHG